MSICDVNEKACLLQVSLNMRLLPFLLFVFWLRGLNTLLIEPPKWPEIWSAQQMWVSIQNTSDLNNFGDWFYNISDTADDSSYRLRQDNHLQCVPQARMNDGNGCSNIWHGDTVYAYSWTLQKCCIIFPDLAPTPPVLDKQ